MNDLSQTITSSVRQRAAEFMDRLSACRNDATVLAGGGSTEVEEVGRLERSYGTQWEELASGRGVDLPVLVFTGETGSGKSTLLALLTGGDLPQGPTKQLIWHGPSAPNDLRAGMETYRSWTSTGPTALAGSCMMLDTPGLGGAAIGDPDLSGRMRTAGRLKVLVLESHRLAAEDWQTHLARSVGAIVLPVVRLSAGESRRLKEQPEEVVGEIAVAMERVSEKLPDIELDQPVVLPDLESSGDPEAVKAEVRETLTSALARFLGRNVEKAADRTRELEASWRQCQTELLPLIQRLVTPGVVKSHVALRNVLQGLPREIILEMLGDTSRLRALFRLDLRGAYVERIPLWAFPYRTVAGLLCLTTGVWDRLVLGLSGSLFSMMATAFSSAKTFRAEQAARHSHGEGASPRMERQVRRRLKEPLHTFRSALLRSRNAEPDVEPGDTEFQIAGVESLGAAWQEGLREAARPAKERGGGLIVPVAVLGALLFWLLFAGPVLHIYGQYIPAAYRSLAGAWEAADLTRYPAMGASFWLTALILSLLPVFLVALLQVSSRLSRRKINGCVERFRHQLLADLDKGNLRLEVELNDPRVEACRRLLSLLPRQNSSDMEPREADPPQA